MAEPQGCYCCDENEQVVGAGLVIYYMLRKGYDLHPDDYSPWLWEVRRRVIEQHKGFLPEEFTILK